MKILKHKASSLYFSSPFDLNKGKHLYKLLKRDLYYETVNLYTRASVAEFDANNLEQKISQFVEFINQKDPLKSEIFKKWISLIKFRLLPKKVALSQDTDNGDAKIFISNLRTSDQYYLSEVNYFCDLPVQLLLLSMLWSVTVGVLLDKKISDNCVGNRLNLSKRKVFRENTFSAFKYYLPEYNRWRDQAINIGLENLRAGNDILLVGMDIRQCYYFIKNDWIEIHQIINDSNLDSPDKDFCHKLTDLLNVVHDKYFDQAKNFLRITHDKYRNITKELSVGLPIGLPSSRILANWQLSYFDAAIIKKLRPIYYGRYVDDFLIVLNNPGRDELCSGNKIIKKFFIETKIFAKSTEDESEKSISYKILGEDENDTRFEFLEIQNDKIIFHFYAHDSSWAGLAEFQDELNKQASEFRFLPIQEKIGEFIDDAHDINYDGSQNKLRSVIGVKENLNKLSNQLYSRILRYWLGNEKLGSNEIRQLKRFYQGRNIFDYARTWERVLSLFIGTGQLEQCTAYYQDLLEVLEKLQPYDIVDEQARNLIKDTKVVSRARKDIIEYLNIALASALSLEASEKRQEINRNSNIHLLQHILDVAKNFRSSCMIRHQLVRWPLLEYLDQDINLINLEFKALKTQNNGGWEKKLEYAPRFISYHEYALLNYLLNILSIGQENSNKRENLISPKEILQKYNLTRTIKENRVKPHKREKENVLEIEIEPLQKKTKHMLCVGVANIKVIEENFKNSYKPNSTPNLSLDRQEDLFRIVNEAIRKPKCDLIVLPEVSIPYMWLPFLANIAQKKQIGLVFGLEHIVINDIVYNLIATILPFGSGAANNCFISLRIKNYYSPEEKIDIESYDFKLPLQTIYYEKIYWRDCWFAVYNCFELTDINSRGLFRSELDLLVSIVWNKDTNYYSNILEAMARDVHVYIVQANTSNYGDSRIVSPKRTEEKDIIRVKGGENSVLLKGYIDIETLRDFQAHKYTQNDNRFKPVPAGFDHIKARKRAK